MRRRTIHCVLAALLAQCTLPHLSAQSGEIPQTASSTQSIVDPRLGERPGAVLRKPEDCTSRAGSFERTCIHMRRHHAFDGSDPAYGPQAWQSHRNRHALIGALIGFAIGAAAGAKGNQDQHTRAKVGAPLLVGAMGALIGAAVGGSHP